MKIKKCLLSFFIFVSALLTRILFIGTDAIYIDESNYFLITKRFFNALFTGNFEGTLVLPHPGITTCWINKITLKITENFLNKELSLLEIYYYPKLSFAIISSILILIIYLLLNRVFNKKISIIASLLIALNPFLIAHSRIIGTDGLTPLFMTVSLLLFLLFIKENKLYYVPISGFFAGLAILTKVQGIFLIPYFLFLILFNFIFDLIKKNKIKLVHILKQIISPIFWAVGCSIVIVLILPVFWTKDYEQILNVLNIKYEQLIRFITMDYARFYLGTNRLEPIYSYYLVVLPFRLTPISFILAPLAFISIMFKKFNIYVRKYLKYIICFIFYIIFFLAMMSTFTYKGDRLILPVFPAIDILSAISIYIIYNLFLDKYNFKHAQKKYKFFSKNSFYLLVSVLIIIHLILYIPFFPHYLAYYNPLLGGAKQAAKMFSVGWGEGLYETAQYLNKKENSKDITVSSWYDVCLQPYFEGRAYPLKYGDSGNIKYILFYVNQLQRNLFPDLIEKYHINREPEHVVKINGLEYVWIYRRAYKEITPKENVFVLRLDDKDKKDFMRKGWYQTETMGTWAGKGVSTILVDIIDKSNYEMEINMMPFAHLDTAQTVKVYINNHPIGHVVLKYAEPGTLIFQTVKIKIPKGFISEEEPELFKFEFSKSAVPFDLGVSEDKRGLSVFFGNKIIFRKLD